MTSFTEHLRRVFILKINTLLCFFIVLFFMLSLLGWTHYQNESLYSSDPQIQRDRPILFVLKALKNTKLEKTSEGAGQFGAAVSAPDRPSTNMARAETAAPKRPLRNVLHPTSEVVRKNKTILYWTKMFSSNNFYFGEGDIFRGCPVWSCEATENRKRQSIDKFDAVMFHGPQLNATDLPDKRSPHQRYIFVDMETQVFHPVPNEPAFNHFFNWTMVYRRDADIMRPYAVFRNVSSNEVIPPQIPAQWVDVSNAVVPESTRRLFRNKTKIAAWFVSHCQTQSNREEVPKKLQNHVTVDVYGKCGQFKCPRTIEADCFKKLESEYFFYLAFENSMCADYVTEKVFKVLEYSVIPLVYGAADYESFLPPNSYINVLDFPSTEILAKFLVELSQDEERYLSYFKWKSFYKVVNTHHYIICEFCKALHQLNSPTSIIENIYGWWVNGSQCKPPPNII